MRLTVPCPPSLHDRSKELRALFRAQLAAQVPCRLKPRRGGFVVRYTLMGDWYEPERLKDGRANPKAGLPNSRDTTNVLKVLDDILAEALGLGKNGKGDNHLCRHMTIETIQSGREVVEVEIT